MLEETNIPAERTIKISSALVYAGSVPVDVLSFDSSVDLFTKAVVSN